MKIDNEMLTRALDKLVEEYIKENDLEKVRHGKWLDCGSIWEGVDVYKIMWRCSECIVPNYRKSRYCPYCGAKMDGKDKEND